MYIRKTKTNNKTTGEAYFTHRLVRGERVPRGTSLRSQGKVRQITVLNLGRHFPTPQEDWPVLSRRTSFGRNGMAAWGNRKIAKWVFLVRSVKEIESA